MTVGIVSAGHMGAGLGWALRDGGARVVTTTAGRSPRTARLAEAAGVERLPTLPDVVAAADTVLLVTPPGAALAAARAVIAACPAGHCPLVADLNALAPSTVEHEAADLDAAGLELVDGSISGPPPTVRAGARIYLAGPRAADVAALPWRHVEVVVLPGPVGQASALKMCTASVYKGLNGLLTQAVRAAAHYGVLDEVLADLAVAGMADTRGIAVAATKAARYVPEMREIAAAQLGAGLTPALFAGLAEVYAEIAATALASGDPETAPRDLPAAELAARLTPPAG